MQFLTMIYKLMLNFSPPLPQMNFEFDKC